MPDRKQTQGLFTGDAVTPAERNLLSSMYDHIEFH